MRTARPSHSAILCVPVTFLALALPAAGQQPYIFTKVVDASTQRPDGKGPFAINTTTTPAFDGQWVVFRDLGLADDLSLQAIWSFNIQDKTFHKLVDLHTVQPGGTATFTELHLQDTAPTIRNGTVIFQARTASITGALEGLYSVPAAGGAITAVADYRTADPSGGTFKLFDASGKQIGGFAFDGTTAAFANQGSTQAVGIYAAKPDGTGLGLIADNLHPYAASGANVVLFSAPAIAGNNVVMAGTDGANPATGYNGLYLGQVGGNGAVTELVNSKQALPGDTNTAVHTRFEAPYLAFDGTLIAFRASNAAAPGASPFYGLYSTDLTSHTIRKIVDVNSTLPGLGKLQSIAAGGVAVSQGNVLFRATDVTTGFPGNSGLYLWTNGAAVRMIGTGDLVEGKAVQVLHEPGPGALAGGGFAFNVEFGPSNAFAIYAATAPITNNASFVNGLSPGALGSIFGTHLSNVAPGTVVVATFPPLPPQLEGVSVTIGGTTAPMVHVANVNGVEQLDVQVPYEVAGQSSVSMVVHNNGVDSAPVQVPVSPVQPGVYSLDNVQAAAFHAASGALVTTANPAAKGEAIVLYATGMGPAQGQPATGSAASTTSLSPTVYSPSIAIGGQPATLIGSALLPGFAGVEQVNVFVPANAPAGNDDLVMTVNGVAAKTMKIAVR